MIARGTATARAPARGPAVPASPEARLPGVVWLFLLVVLVPVTVNAGGLSLTSLRILMLVLLVPLTVRLLRGAYGPLIATDWLLFAHAGWLTLALAVNNPDRVIQQAPSVSVEFLGSYLLARATIRSPEAFIALVRCLAWVVALTIPLALIETRTGVPVLPQLIARLPVLASVEDIPALPRMGLNRVQVVFPHPIHYGLFCSVVFSLVFVGLKGRVRATRRAAVTLMVGAAGFLSLSSGALLAIALQCGLIVWAAMFRGIHWRWRLLVGMFALAWVVIDLLSNRTPMQVFMSYATFSPHNAWIRAIIFEWGMMNVRDNPVFGLGLRDWVRPDYLHHPSVDNFWLLQAMRYGLPGFALLAAGWLALLVGVMRRPFDGDSEAGRLRRAWVFTFIGLTLTLATVAIWSTIYGLIFFMLGTGAWLLRHEAPAAVTPRSTARRDPSALPAAPPPARPAPRAPGPGRPERAFTRFPDGARPARSPA